MQPAALSDTNYYTQLGLEYDPFAANAMPDFFFVGAQRRYLVQRAVHAVYFSGATVLLIGGGGIGKTRTLGEIQKELKDLVDICRIDATVLMDAAEIRVLLAVKLGFATHVAASNAELTHALERLRPADGDPQPIVLAIDAAQLLSIDTLSECAALIADAGGRLRLLLAGEPDLMLAWQQAQAGAAETLELAALDRNEAADYVRTKLQVAGYRGESPLTDAEFDRLFAQTNGNFAAIDAAIPAFLQTSAEVAPTIRRFKAFPVVHIGVAAAIVTIVSLIMLYRGDDSPDQKTSREIPTTPPSNSVNKNADQRTVALQLPTSAVPAVNSAPSPSSPPQQSSPPQASSSATDSASVASEPQLNRAVEKPPVPESKSKSEQKVSPAPKLKKEIANKNNEKGTELRSDALKEKTETQEKKTVDTANASLSADERALLALPSSGYVLQLIGAESRSTVDKFSSGAGKGLKLYCYRTQLRGKPWLIVVTGPYADKRAAQAALSTLPESVRKQRPWSRTVANVQADIRARNR